MRIVKNRLTLAAFGAAAFACGLLVATAAGVLALPIPTVPQRVDIPCRVPYELAAGERALLFCMPRNYTLRGGERATAQSRHEDVDIAAAKIGEIARRPDLVRAGGDPGEEPGSKVTIVC